MPEDNLQQGVGAPDWIQGLPEDVRGSSKTVEKYVKDGKLDAGELAKGYINLAGLQGKSIAQVPDESATPEERAEFFNKIGRPEKVEDYKVKVFTDKMDPSTIPDGEIPLSQDQVNAFLQAAHTAGLTNAQAEAVIGFHLESIKGQLKAYQDAQNEAKTQLQKSWGDKYDANLAAAKNVVMKFGGEDVLTKLDEAGLSDNPAMIQLLHTISKEFSPDRLVVGTTPEIKNTLQEKLNKILNDSKHPFNVKGHPEHRAAVAEVEEIHRRLSEGQTYSDD